MSYRKCILKSLKSQPLRTFNCLFSAIFECICKNFNKYCKNILKIIQKTKLSIQKSDFQIVFPIGVESLFFNAIFLSVSSSKTRKITPFSSTMSKVVCVVELIWW